MIGGFKILHPQWKKNRRRWLVCSLLGYKYFLLILNDSTIFIQKILRLCYYDSSVGMNRNMFIRIMPLFLTYQKSVFSPSPPKKSLEFFFLVLVLVFRDKVSV